MKQRISFILILTLGVTLFLSGQSQTDWTKKTIFKPDDFVRKPGGFLHKLIDPSKFEMQQSYSLSFMSDGRRSGNLGLYLNTLNYQFSDPLMMQIRVGVMHQPLGGNQMVSEKNGQVFLQRAMLRYQPMDNMSVTLDYQSYPSPMMSPYYWNR